MRSYHVFAILLSVICLLAIQAGRSSAQVPCPNKLFGIPICTGFCVELDSLAPAHKHRKHNYGFFGDSVMKDFKGLLPDSNFSKNFIEGRTNFKMPEFRGFAPMIPSQNFEMQDNHINGFPGWYWKKLADNSADH